MPRYYIPVVVVAIVLGVFLAFGSRLYKTVPVGHVGVATLFGEPVEKSYGQGLHIPVNPLYAWTLFDVRDQTHKDTVSVPSQDQLQTQIDVSVQFRLNGEMAAQILEDTGTFESAKAKYLEPSLRSILREAGKTIRRAEDFFLEETQEQLQTNLLVKLQEYLGPKGITVERVFIRDINLPPFITRAIEQKKEREQEVEKQKAELERFRTEQQQIIAEAEAKRQAAEEEAAMRRVLADAQAYEIEMLNEAIANNPAYIQLEALKALKEISKDPSSKLYFLNSESTQPLPLMNMGEPLIGR